MDTTAPKPIMQKRLSRHGNEQFAYLHDSAAETGNSGLSKLKVSARYLNKRYFMDLVRLHLEIQNRVRILKMIKEAEKHDVSLNWIDRIR